MIELAVVAILRIVSNNFNIVVNVLYFLYFSLDLLILCLKYVIISLMLLFELVKEMKSFFFFSNQCSKSIFSNGADENKLSVFLLHLYTII